VEVLLYLALTVLILSVITVVFTQIVETRQRARTLAEVDQQGIQIMQQITQVIRDAEAINSPAIGTSASTLNLDVITASDDPTVYSLNGTTLEVTRGGGGAIALSSNRVVVTSITFSNLSRTGTNGTVRIEFTLSYVNDDGTFAEDYTQSFYGSATLREN